MAWTSFLSLGPEAVRWNQLDLKELLDGGQTFRWFFSPSTGHWEGSWAGHEACLRIHNGHLEAAFPLRADPDRSLADLRIYLGLDETTRRAMEDLPWRSDPILEQCRQAFPRLRILRQPAGEALLSFLCSATKQIPQIKQCLDLLARRWGQPTENGRYHLPTWEVLAEVPESELRECLLGFRARHIKATAIALRQMNDPLVRWSELADGDLRRQLESLPGVGPKVADCVMLFGFYRLGAFPVDTWIARAMRQWYGLEGWTLSQIGHFGRVHFGGGAGLAQQLMFARIRQMSTRGQKL